jgi:type VI secretion system protein ImpC
MPSEESEPVASPPRVQISYDVEIGDAVETKELPFVVGVLADLAFSSEPPLPRLQDQRFVTVDRDNFDAVMKALALRAIIEVENRLNGDAARLKVELHFTCLADFEPLNVARQVEPLCRLLDRRSQMAQTRSDVYMAGVLDFAELDGLVSSQLDEIMHAPEFQRAEATWRGLHYLVFSTPATLAVKIRVLNVSKAGLLRDLQRAPEVGQSEIYKKVVEETYGVFGSEPYGVLIGDYEFGPDPEDVELLQGMSLVGSAAHAPFIAAASPAMFNLDSFTDLTRPRDLAKIFETQTYSLWNRLREEDDSRYIGLVLPCFLLRLPYGKDKVPGEAFHYKEHLDRTVHQHYLWGNSAYAFGTRLTASFARYGWFATIRGVNYGGLVKNLPSHMFTTAEGDVAMKCPTEIAITDGRESELVRLGFIPLCHAKNTGTAVFFSVPSCHKPEGQRGDRANWDATLAARLDHVLAVSRFAHYLKVIVRDQIGCVRSRVEWERDLNNWIGNYVTNEDSPDLKLGAQFPLREGRIQLVGTPSGKFVTYKATATLRPHFQLEEMDAPMNVEVLLPPVLAQEMDC